MRPHSHPVWPWVEARCNHFFLDRQFRKHDLGCSEQQMVHHCSYIERQQRREYPHLLRRCCVPGAVGRIPDRHPERHMAGCVLYHLHGYYGEQF